ncbi:MAG: branched-chain-amino-acid transaminase [Methanosarcinales archaeon]
MDRALVYIDGEYFEKDNAKISVFDHGFLYGDGVFESIRCYNGNVFGLQEHIERLYESAKLINLEIPETREKMINLVCETIKRTKLKDAYVRLVISRGIGDLGLDPKKCPEPSTVIIAQQADPMYGDLYDKGISVITVGVRRIASDAIDVRAKTLNYLNNILAKIQANIAGCQEALMLNHLGYVCEGTGDNLFIVKKGDILTPPTESGALKGITRQFIFELSEKLNISCKEKNLTSIDVYTCDEAFMTGTLAEIVPVVEIDDRKIGNGKPGLITKKLMEEFVEIREEYGVGVYK